MFLSNCNIDTNKIIRYNKSFGYKKKNEEIEMVTEIRSGDKFIDGSTGTSDFRENDDTIGIYRVGTNVAGGSMSATIISKLDLKFVSKVFIF
jgi:hypothetical protein